MFKIMSITAAALVGLTLLVSVSHALSHSGTARALPPVSDAVQTAR